MRKRSLLALGFWLYAACGGEAPSPQAPAPAPEPPPPVASAPAEPPKEAPRPKESLGQLIDKTGRAMVEAINARDAKKLAALYADGGVVKVAGAPADASGREAIAQSWQKLFDAFPDFSYAPLRVFTKGDVTVVEWVMNGTHKGELFGIKGTEKKVGLRGVDVAWFNPDGQVKEQHTTYDGATILAQIGVSNDKVRPIPPVPSAAPQVVAGKGSPDEATNIATAKAMNEALDMNTVATAAGKGKEKKEGEYLAGIADAFEFDDMVMPQTVKGKAEAKKFYREITSAFPDLKMSIQNAWGFEDFVVIETTWSGTHKGPGLGLPPPTKKSITVKGVDVYQFKDGKLVHGWAYGNGADLAMQLGLAPKPAAKKPAPTEKK